MLISSCSEATKRFWLWTKDLWLSASKNSLRTNNINDNKITWKDAHTKVCMRRKRKQHLPKCRGGVTQPVEGDVKVRVSVLASSVWKKSEGAELSLRDAKRYWGGNTKEEQRKGGVWKKEEVERRDRTTEHQKVCYQERESAEKQ